MIFARLYGPKGWLAILAGAIVVFVVFPALNLVVSPESVSTVPAI